MIYTEPQVTLLYATRLCMDSCWLRSSTADADATTVHMIKADPQFSCISIDHTSSGRVVMQVPAAIENVVTQGNEAVRRELESASPTPSKAEPPSKDQSKQVCTSKTCNFLHTFVCMSL